MRIRPRLLFLLSSAVTFIASTTATVAARADVTIVSIMTTTGKRPGEVRPVESDGDAKPVPEATTILVQGHKFRIETAKTVELYDADTMTRYKINVADKTYSVGAEMKSIMPMMAKMLDVKTTFAVAPTGKTRMVLGQNAKEYTYSETVSLSLKPGALAQPGATPNPALAKAAPVPVMLIKIQGQQWVGAVAGLPESAGDIIGESSGMGDLLKTMPGLKALSDGLKGIKGYPLASHESVTMTGLGIAASMGQSNSHFTVDTTTTAIRQTPLSKSLFVIPPGYKKIEPPSPLPGRGMRNRSAMPF